MQLAEWLGGPGVWHFGAMIGVASQVATRGKLRAFAAAL